MIPGRTIFAQRTNMRLPLHRGAEPIANGGYYAKMVYCQAESWLYVGHCNIMTIFCMTYLSTINFYAAIAKGSIYKVTMRDQEKIMSAKQPEDCQTMADVRAGVDALDGELVALLSKRFGYMSAAARIKTERSAVRDEGRKAEVIANARQAAMAQNVPADFVADIWEQLVETSIAYELKKWDQLRG
jgi:isochorismate pyruvate lyase